MLKYFPKKRNLTNHSFLRRSLLPPDHRFAKPLASRREFVCFFPPAIETVVFWSLSVRARADI